MYFEQVVTPGLGCFSYLVGCPQAGIMAVVDPKRDIEIYIERSKQKGMRITHIFDTHVHADHVSGAGELSRATGAPIYIHESAPIGYKANTIKDGDAFTFGSAHIRVLHTPGHTPNSIALLVADTARSSQPQMILTGDLLFVGDTGRPDLPGHEILDEQVRNLFDSLHTTLAELPDGLEVYPAHGQGSLCGGGMSAKPHTTLGYERVANPRLQLKNFEAFKADILSNLPMRPQSFSHIIATNLQGAPLLERCEPAEKALPAEGVAELREKGHLLLDLRDSLSFAAAHIPGCIHVDGTQPQYPNWVGTVVPPDVPLILILDQNQDFAQRRTELLRIGYDTVAGYLDGGIKSWIARGWEVQGLPLVSVESLRRRLQEPEPPLIIDVRTSREFAHSHMEGAVNLPFEELLAGSACPGPSERTRAVVCQTGYRAAIAAGLLQARGCSDVSVLAGGYAAYLHG